MMDDETFPRDEDIADDPSFASTAHVKRGPRTSNARLLILPSQAMPAIDEAELLASLQHGRPTIDEIPF